jgi:hypothetical protein
MVKGRRGANCKEEPTRAMGSGADSILSSLGITPMHDHDQLFPFLDILLFLSLSLPAWLNSPSFLSLSFVSLRARVFW